jgi:hypothetical protein
MQRAIALLSPGTCPALQIKSWKAGLREEVIEHAKCFIFTFCWPFISINRVKKTNLMHNLFLVCFFTMYMFRAYLGQSSGGTTVCKQQLVLIILFRWLSVFLFGLVPIQSKQQTVIIIIIIIIISTNFCIYIYIYFLTSCNQLASQEGLCSME